MAAVAETNRAPFDLVEAEQELVGGFHTEYTGIRFAIFFLAEYMNMATQSAIAVTLFLGGPAGPLPPFVPELIGGLFWFLFKVSLFLLGYIWLRAALPRLRYDQLMDLGLEDRHPRRPAVAGRLGHVPGGAGRELAELDLHRRAARRVRRLLRRPRGPACRTGREAGEARPRRGLSGRREVSR